MNQDLQHYIAKHKEHEVTRTSTNERNNYWYNYKKNNNYTPQSLSRFEHG